LARLTEKYPDDVRLVYRHFPLDIHDKAQLAAEAAEAAGAQGKFWEMDELLFAEQGNWAALSVEDFRGKLDEYAAQLELDRAQFAADLDDGAFTQVVKDALTAATNIRLPDGTVTSLPGTPFFVINDQPYQGPAAFWAFDAVVKLELLKDRQFPAPQEVIDPLKHYTATLKTAKGDIVVKLFAEQTPITVNNFVFLARRGWFDGVSFHRVLPGFVAQSGDPTGTGFGGPGYYIKNEIVPELKFDAAGVLGMANSGADTNGSQFFITLAPAPSLDGQYTVFGKVVDGLEVVNTLSARDPQNDPEAPEGDRILSVTIEEQ
jgi:cyclophilin family peptidyl-prolyl cis-trans isomerase